MQKKILINIAKKAVLAATICWTFIFIGCEGSDDPGASGLDDFFANHPFISDPRDHTDSPIQISPSSASVSAAGAQAVFTVNGGSGPYTWDVAIPANGSVSYSANNHQGVYTVAKVAENDVIVYDREGHAAIASINTDDATELSVTADSTTLTNNTAKTTISASGGIQPYSWTLQDDTLGSVAPDSGESVIYTRDAAGDNGVTVTDENGSSASIVIKQP